MRVRLQKIVIKAHRPRYAAPTEVDSIGRIWAPVVINGMGPFRLVLDSGASRSGLIPSIAHALGLQPNHTRAVRLHGVTGSAVVPTVHVGSLAIGDLPLGSAQLPIVADAFGGAEGVLGTDRLTDDRVYIDFRHDRIEITHSRNQPAPAGFLTIPFHMIDGRLISVRAWIGNIPVVAIIDTGGQVTVGNVALRKALKRQAKLLLAQTDKIMGVTRQVQQGEEAPTPPIFIGAGPSLAVEIHDRNITFVDLQIFKSWKLLSKPAVLVGMDALGRLSAMVIDFRDSQLQVKMADGT